MRSKEVIQETFDREGDALVTREEFCAMFPGCDVPGMNPGTRYSLRDHTVYYSAKWITETVVATRADVDSWIGRTI